MSLSKQCLHGRMCEHVQATCKRHCQPLPLMLTPDYITKPGRSILLWVVIYQLGQDCVHQPGPYLSWVNIILEHVCCNCQASPAIDFEQQRLRQARMQTAPMPTGGSPSNKMCPINRLVSCENPDFRGINAFPKQPCPMYTRNTYHGRCLLGTSATSRQTSNRTLTVWRQAKCDKNPLLFFHKKQGFTPNPLKECIARMTRTKNRCGWSFAKLPREFCCFPSESSFLQHGWQSAQQNADWKFINRGTSGMDVSWRFSWVQKEHHFGHPPIHRKRKEGDLDIVDFHFQFAPLSSEDAHYQQGM